MIEIKSRNGSGVLYTASTARDVRTALTEAVRRGADLQGADLRGAYLQGADLRGAYLQGADLQGAHLQGAHLQGAHLQGAYLQGAVGVNPHVAQPLHILADQVGKIRAYKLVTSDLKSPIHYGKTLTYEKGKTVEVKGALTDPNVECGAGVNVATLDWCIKNWSTGRRILIVEFTAKDIAAIPTTSDGKFRLHRCKVVGEKKLEEIGLA